MTEFQLKPPHISVKARAREINARVEAGPQTAALCVRRDNPGRSSKGDQRPQPLPTSSDEGGRGFQESRHPVSSQDQTPTTERGEGHPFFPAGGGGGGGGGGGASRDGSSRRLRASSSGGDGSEELVPKIAGPGSEDEQSGQYGCRERSAATLGKQVSVFQTFLGDLGESRPAQSTRQRRKKDPPGVVDLPLWDDESQSRRRRGPEPDRSRKRDTSGGERRRDVGDACSGPATYLVTCTLQINNNKERPARATEENLQPRLENSTGEHSETTELGLKGAPAHPERGGTIFIPAGAGNSSAIFSERAALDKSPAHSTEGVVEKKHSLSPLDEILCTLERICDEFSSPGWGAGDAPESPTAPPTAQYEKDDSTGGGGVGSRSVFSRGTTPVPDAFFSCPSSSTSLDGFHGDLSEFDVNQRLGVGGQRHRTSSATVERVTTHDCSGGVDVNEAQEAMNGNFHLGNTPNLDHRELKPSVSTSVLLPTVLVTTLTKLPSSSKVSSVVGCHSPKSQVRTKPDLPAYLTLGRRGFFSKKSQHNAKENEVDKVRDILASLDFSKYRRGRASKEEDPTDESPMDKSPKPPRSPMAKSGSKMKDLTDRLKPQTPSTAPASPNLGIPKEGRSATMPTPATDVMARKPYLVTRSSSFSQVELSGDRPNKESPLCKDLIHGSTGISTLPRRKSPRLTTLLNEKEKSVSSDSTRGLVSVPTSETLKSDSSVHWVATDEGMVSDSDSVQCYVNAYCSITSPNYQDASAPSACVQSKSFHQTKSSAPSDESSNALMEKISNSLVVPFAPDKRKRRKGIGGPSVEFQTGTQDHTKSSNGRSLTYPPQRKSSISEEDLDYTSVDSNGLRSLNMSSGLTHDALRQPSDLSLADSHLCPSEIAQGETYQDVVKSMKGGDMQRLNVEDRNNKALKKKHHSDPGGDKTSGESVDFPELIAASRSEPELCDQPIPPPSDSSLSSATSSITALCGNAGATDIPDEGGSGGQSNVQGFRLAIKESNSSHVQGVHPRHVRMASDCLTPSPLLQSRCFGSEGGDLSERVTFGKSPQEQRRYSKKRLRGPYGEMLEEEMRKSGEKQKPSVCDDLSFLQQLCDKKEQQQSSALAVSLPETTPRFSSSQSLDDSALKTEKSDTAVPKRKISANYPLVVSESVSSQQETGGPLVPVTAPQEQQPQDSRPPTDVWGTSDIKDGEDGSCAQGSWARRHQDTRTHVVGELYDTEKSYVESLQILVNKYMKPLKGPEHCGIVDASLVDEIFYQIPEILNHHEAFLEVLRQRLSNWDSKQKVGDVFVDAFTKQTVIDTYTAFINNWKSAKEGIKLASQAKPAFAKFLEHMSREHKGKLTLDALLIMPVQRIPRYELLIKELLKHTHVDHPDHQLLVMAQKEVHELAVKINRVEREAFQHEQMQQRVKEIEHLIEGVMDLVQPDRIFIRYDLVSIPGGLGTKKERCLFLFSDLLLITSIKRKSGTIRKASSSVSSPSVIGPLDMNKYKLLMRFSLDNLDITKSSDGNVRKLLKEIENLEEDMSLLGQITELTSNLNFQHQALDEAVRELMGNISKQLSDKQNADAQLLSLELTVTTQEGVDSLTIIFPAPEKRSAWELAFNEAKQKLALSTDRRPPPEFMYPLPIRKTRAGLQFTCAAATLGLNQFGMKDVWVCNSDGYVGQVCVLSLQPEPTVTSCNGVCNARILAIASIPAASPIYQPVGRRCSVVAENVTGVNIDVEETEDEDDSCTNNGNIQLDSDSSDDEEEDDDDDDEETDSLDEEPQKQCSLPRDDSHEDMDHQQPTMWLGTEDGCIHIYNCSDNIRIKKNKVKIQHPAAIYYIIYLDNRVFVSLANGELHIYKKDLGGGWNAGDPQKAYVGSPSSPVTRILTVAGKLWCGCQNTIRVLNVGTLTVEHTFQASNDPSRSVLCMVTSGLGVWLAIQHSAVIRLFHATTYECLLDVNVAPAVTKMLAGCDDIIRQHKAACLRVTSLLTCKDLLWIGTSAGVVLTLPLPHLTSTTTKLDTVPNVSGLPHGHTGHVRFLTSVEMSSIDTLATSKYGHRSTRGKEGVSSRRSSTTVASGCKLLVISGGDGYEDFRTTGLSEAAGRDDSTNHLLLWQV